MVPVILRDFCLVVPVEATDAVGVMVVDVLLALAWAMTATTAAAPRPSTTTIRTPMMMSSLLLIVFITDIVSLSMRCFLLTLFFLPFYRSETRKSLFVGEMEDVYRINFC